MAHILQTVTPLAAIEQFGLARTEGSFQPRGRITFHAVTVVVAKIATNTQTVEITLTLPPNFAYVLDTAFVTIESALSVDVDNYDPLATMILRWDTSVTSLNAVSTLKSEGVSQFGQLQTGGSQTWNLANPFHEVMFNQNGEAPSCVISLDDTDGTNNTDALNMPFYFSFLQYDIMQATEVFVNAPQPVSVR